MNTINRCYMLLLAMVASMSVHTVQAQDADGNLLGKGTHTRYVVDRLRFMEKLKK